MNCRQAGGKGMQGEKGLAHEAPVPLVNGAMSSMAWLGLTKADGSVSDGGYDFIVGKHHDDFKALNVFSFDNYDKLIPREQKDILDALKSNTLTYDKIKKSDTLRLLPALGNKTQTGINIHGGTNSYTDSKGCFTIYGMDWGSNTPQKDYKKFIDRFKFNQLGKLYLIR